MPPESTEAALARLEATFTVEMRRLEQVVIAKVDSSRELLAEKITSGDKETMSALRLAEQRISDSEKDIDKLGESLRSVPELVRQAFVDHKNEEHVSLDRKVDVAEGRIDSLRISWAKVVGVGVFVSAPGVIALVMWLLSHR